MDVVTVTYPSFSGSHEAQPLPAQAIWAIARDVRRQICGSLRAKPLPAGNLIRRVWALKVNGIELYPLWDSEHEVHDDDGHPVMGICEYDPDTPGNVLLSLNAAVLGDRVDLAASTAAHELGHAIFDMPAAVISCREQTACDAESRRRFRHVTPDESHFRGMAADEAERWSEYRANEFMGGLLAPPDLLHRAAVVSAGQLGVPLTPGSPRAGKPGFPLIDGRCWDPVVQDALLDDLSEAFGVSPSFIWVRLRKYQLVSGQQ